MIKRFLRWLRGDRRAPAKAEQQALIGARDNRRAAVRHAEIEKLMGDPDFERAYFDGLPHQVKRRG
jgi:hypothetical protein